MGAAGNQVTTNSKKGTYQAGGLTLPTKNPPLDQIGPTFTALNPTFAPSIAQAMNPTNPGSSVLPAPPPPPPPVAVAPPTPQQPVVAPPTPPQPPPPFTPPPPAPPPYIPPSGPSGPMSGASFGGGNIQGAQWGPLAGYFSALMGR